MTRSTRVYRLDVTYPLGSHPTTSDGDEWWDWTPAGWWDDVRAEWAEYRRALAEFRAAGGDPTDPFGSPLRPQTPEDEPRFDWPSHRDYLSKSGAEQRANLLRRYGATVAVHASNPITWPAREDTSS